MPNMANITVKAANGTTDKVFTSLTPSAGDTVAATWSDTTESVPDFRPRLSMVTRFNGPRTARVARVLLTFPIKGTVGGAEQVVARVPMEFSMTLPTNVASSAVEEAIAQGTNLLVSTLIRDSLKAGYSPT